ncbi:MAG TPA: hypothetical protein VN666_14035 [Nitrospira sp.]|nr:hypothetical protein [Nitrospira sp.]
MISTPGEYAAAEAFKALRLGLNVMLFSDNVDLKDEIALKRFAQERDLIVMGPDAELPLSTASRLRSRMWCGAESSVSSAHPAPASNR